MKKPVTSGAIIGFQPVTKLGLRQGFGIEVALCKVTTHAHQRIGLNRLLYAFSHHIEPQFMAQLNRGLNNASGPAVGQHFTGKTAIYFEGVDGKVG